ncbi:putative diguanylate cyclase/phosphodiesterase with PAS sensor [Actinoplanes missouriensis 431]|uniref:Putative diguanylate cyclase/phosphodiesterase with PAS sensor n=1 Tax=Actinoplanes missouriensis (strain ATCC 14538 / DSM 43046 / CBS 188.64 / JCM 3121 / NBRC 102363 / NCIMB 12654 / NRRL B-3342 / UNCC 431) TaxID=512565 RepID=I0HG88_ACTM4|nr:EAL domain-containing protein [Actinoplanes missouriensis]BAL92025.1 putative diguanylate cyclase/phosphodiesterase with PAS sensor [Actinoplanes missouriensis 431]
MPSRWSAALFGVWMAVLVVVLVLEPGLQSPLRLLAGASAVAAVVAGMRGRQPDDTRPWWLLAAAVGLSAAGGAASTAPAFLTDRLVWLEPAGTVLLLVAYLLLAVALGLFVRRRTESARDRAGLLDALTVTAGVALLIWTFVVGPRFDGSTADTWADLAMPLADLLCLGFLIRLATMPGRLVAPGHCLGAGVFAMLVADVARHPAVGHVAFYMAAGLAALIPSMAELTRPGEKPPVETSRGRLALLALAALVAPTVLLVKMYRDSQVAGLTVVAALSMLMLLLVLARMAGIMTSHGQVMARERGLREASAALVSAADTESVGLAVRTAVAQLIPGDAPHGVVLAVTIVQAEPQSPEAAAQAAVDRATGTAARLVSTRDVDWAVAVRLSQFNKTLRCPMVLKDRPTGDPLLGVLHVGAPTWALLELQRSVEVLAGQVALALERIALSQEVARRNSETYFRTLIQNTADVIMIIDERDRIRYASPSAVGVFGGDPTGALLPEVIHPGERDRLSEVLTAVRGGDQLQQQLDFRARGNRRTEVLLELHCRDLRAEPTVAGLVVTMRDVTEQRQLERELTHQAFHDAMTGLANRVLFNDRLKHALARGARDGSVVGVLFIDLDDFKIVNDTLGHAVGDQLLIAVAHRIAGALRADDTAARLGGDEFAALVENVNDPGAVEETANRIFEAFAQPVETDAKPLYPAASIGITTTPEADDADELLRQADLALYVAKGAGKNQWRRYQAHLHAEMVERLELRSALDHAVNEGHFLLHYQPIVDLAAGTAVGFEALVRWHHPRRGIVTPDQFIEVAEESGLILPMGRWVLEEALRTAAEWRRILPAGQAPYMSVNVSVRQFRESGFVDQVRAALTSTGVPANSLMLEITETLLVKDDEQIWADLGILRDMGIRIAIDDFGTGYSSLGYLRQRPIDVVKIDKMFIDDMVTSQQPMALVSGIVNLAQSQGLVVVAEGIEQPAHRDLLVKMGCPLGQGYLFSSPLGPTEVLAWLRNTQSVAV